MRGTEFSSVLRSAIVGVWVSATLGFAQPIPPVFVPFETANRDFFGNRFDDSIHGFFGVEREIASLLSFSPGAARINEGFREFEEEAQSSVDEVPIPSGSVSIRYVYDSKLDTFVRTQQPFAPALSLNAPTDGRGVLTIGIGFSYVNYQNFEGQDRDGVVFPVDLGVPDAQGNPIFDEEFFQFKLRQSIYTFAVSYGVLDNVDVGVLVPVIDESFRGRIIDGFFSKNPDGSLQRLAVTQNGDLVPDPRAPATRKITLSSFNVFPGETPNPGLVFHEQVHGVGDLILRSKAFLGDFGGLALGAAVNLRVPTGNEDDLLGVGSVRVDPKLLISTSTERFAIHTNQGVHVDADDHTRDRYDYSVGGEVLALPWLTILIDQVGLIEFSGSNKIQKFDIVPGIKANVYKAVVVGFNAIVPLNDDGLRTDYTPNATVEVSTAF